MATTQYRLFRRKDSPPPPPPDPTNRRDALVVGTYIPGWTADTAGLLDPAAITSVREREDSTGYIYIDSVPPDGIIRNTLFKGKVKVRTAGGVEDSPGQIWFQNCLFANRPPEQVNSVGNGNGGCIENFGANPPFLKLTDCKLDPQWWFDNGLSSLKGSPLQVGLHGGNAHLNRCELVNCQDGFQLVGASDATANANSSVTIENSWIHKAYYLKPWDSTTGIPLYPASHDTHSDGIQFNTHRNVTVRYNMIGGIYDGTGYAATPAYNSGDDCKNSCFEIAQEGGTLVTQEVKNLLIENNWLMGGAASFNLFYKNGNNGSTWTIRNNKIARRGSTQEAGNGYYIYVSSQIAAAAAITGNVIWDSAGSINGTSTPATIFSY